MKSLGFLRVDILVSRVIMMNLFRNATCSLSMILSINIWVFMRHFIGRLFVVNSDVLEDFITKYLASKNFWNNDGRDFRKDRSLRLFIQEDFEENFYKEISNGDFSRILTIFMTGGVLKLDSFSLQNILMYLIEHKEFHAWSPGNLPHRFSLHLYNQW